MLQTQLPQTTIYNRMVWKLRRRRSKDSLKSQSSGPRRISRRQLKSCIKHDDGSAQGGCSMASSTTSVSPSDSGKCDLSTACTESRGGNDAPSTGSTSSSLGIHRRTIWLTESQGSASLDSSVHRLRGPAHMEVTVPAESRSPPSKAVQFSTVELRSYERTLSDNPSCSDGAPIGIGWGYDKQKRLPLDLYESSKSYKKSQLEMTLTRDERHQLLDEWGVSPGEISGATRGVHKAKNQRRQTIRNLHKAEKLEETLESATRKLKSAFLMKTSSKKQLEELQRQVDMIASINAKELVKISAVEDSASLNDTSESMKSEERSKDSDETSEEFEIDGAVQALDSMSYVSGFTLGATTLGNSTTSSVQEMEEFYRELELEMFGDQELPSMVGQTLEVNVQIPCSEKVYDEPSSTCRSEGTTSAIESLGEEGNIVFHNMDDSSGFQQQVQHCHPRVQQSAPCTPSPAVVEGTHPSTYPVHPDHVQITCLPRSPMPAPYSPQYAHLVAAQLQYAKESPQSLYHRPSPVSPTSHGMPTTAFQLTAANISPESSRWGSGISYSRSSGSAQRQGMLDGPRIEYKPVLSNLCPTQWMEGHDTTTTLPGPPGCQPVTISEEDCDDFSLDLGSGIHMVRPAQGPLPTMPTTF